MPHKVLFLFFKPLINWLDFPVFQFKYAFVLDFVNKAALGGNHGRIPLVPSPATAAAAEAAAEAVPRNKRKHDGDETEHQHRILHPSQANVIINGMIAKYAVRRRLLMQSDEHKDKARCR